MIVTHCHMHFLGVEKRIDLLSRPKPLPHGFIDDRYEIQKQSYEVLLEINFLRMTGNALKCVSEAVKDKMFFQSFRGTLEHR